MAQNTQSEQPNYYSIITAQVRYDKTLSSSQKLLFAEITSLTNKSGVCWASNNYFARLYEVDPSTVSKWVSGLLHRGYIRINYIREGKEIKQRRIEINQYPIEKNQGGIEIIQEGIEKTPKRIVKANNIKNNKKEYNNKLRTFSNATTRTILSSEEFDKIMNNQ